MNNSWLKSIHLGEVSMLDGDEELVHVSAFSGLVPRDANRSRDRSSGSNPWRKAFCHFCLFLEEGVHIMLCLCRFLGTQ